MEFSHQNHSFPRLLELANGMIEQIDVSNQREINAFRLGTFMTGMKFTYITYVQPAVGLMSLLVLIFSALLLVRLTIRVFVSDVFFLCSFVKCLPRIILIPLNIVFTQYYDPESPMLYPWCFIYLLIFDLFTKTCHFIALNWHILLAINRFCSVYYPFKTRVWFSSTRNKIYCSGILVMSILIVFALNFKAFGQTTDYVVQDIRGDGRYQIYEVCSYENIVIISEDSGLLTNIHYTSTMIETFITMACTICLGILNAILLVKLWRMKKQQIDSFEGSAVFVKKNSNRMLMMNKIFCLVITGVLLVEIPHVILYILTIIEGFSIKFNGVDGRVQSDFLSDLLTLILYDVFAPFDIFLFLVSSRKVRKHFTSTSLFQMFCSRKPSLSHVK